MHIRIYSLTLVLYLLLMQNVYSSNKALNLTEVELADTPYKQMQGLMNRQQLCDTCAMLFVFNYPANGQFWMKNTKVSLDIIFLAHDGRIINIHENAEPMNTQKLYYSNETYWFVLEAKAGFAKRNNLQAGDTLDIKGLFLQTRQATK